VRVRSRRPIATALALLVAIVVAAGCGGTETPEAPDQLPPRQHPAAVPDGFFGVNGQGLRPLAEDGRLDLLGAQLDRIAAGGIDFIRANIDWTRLEPAAPRHGRHSYEFGGLDACVKALQVHRRGERVQPAVAEDRHARRPGLELDPDLGAEVVHVAIAGEQVVVLTLDQHAVAGVDCRRLAAQPGPALVDIGLVAELRQPVSGGEAGLAGSEDSDPHGRGRLHTPPPRIRHGFWDYIDSGAETPISPSVVAIVRFAAMQSASRAASTPGPSAPTTRQSR
jgi:hypothetical protein